MEGHMLRNLINSLSHDGSQGDHRSRKNSVDALMDSDFVDRGDLDSGDAFVPVSPADGSSTNVSSTNVLGQAPLNGAANTTLSPVAAVLSASGSSGSTTLTVGSGSGIIFKNTFDSSCSQAYINSVVAAENAIRSQWTNSITLNLDFTAVAQGTSTFLATNSASSGVNVTYAQLRQALQKADRASPDTYAQTAAWFLPTTSPSGTTDFSIPEAYARMLGLSSATPAVDATITLNTSFNWSFGQDVIDTVEHEISEGAMGRVGGLGDNSNGWSTMDLFRYSASGTLDTTDGRDGNTTFFSFDGGSTLSSLAFNNEFNTSGTKANSNDTSDFTGHDVFGTGSTGETNTLSATDLDVMDVLGWIPSSPHGTPLIVTTNLTLWENTSLDGYVVQDGMSNPSGDSITRFAFRDMGSNGQLTLNGTPEPAGQWVYVDANSLASLAYRAGASPGTDSIQEAAFDATLSKWIGDSTFSVTTTVEPVVSIKNFAVHEGQSIPIAPITEVSNPSGDTITEYEFMDAGTNGHFAIQDHNGTVIATEPASHLFAVPGWGLGDVQYVSGSTTGADPIEIRAFDVTTESWTAISSSTATTTVPIVPPPGGGPSPSPVHALAVTSQSIAGAAPLTSNAADTLVAGFADATLVGGPGSDTFVIGPGAGQEKIQNFDPGHDTLQFSPALLTNYAAAMSDAKQVGADTVFTIDGHDSVALQNVNIGSLAAGNFHFG
jgi:hypothetical protein